MRGFFRRRHIRPRFLLACAPLLPLFVLARPTPAAYAAGSVLVAAGAALRVWGAGHLVKTDALTTTGPYAYIRHPLYAGTLLVTSGLAVGAGGTAAWLLLPLLFLVFFGYYFPYKDRIESARLERIYGEPYAAYRARVPALLPLRRPLRPRPPGAPGRWSARRFRDNHESGTLIAVGIGMALLALRPLAPL